MDIQQIKASLIKLNKIEEKIEYLEGLYVQDKSHFVLYTLSSLYIETEKPARAEILLKEDLDRVKDPFDAYESYSLLTGLYIDQKKEIPGDEIDRYLHLFQKMKKTTEKMGAAQGLSSNHGYEENTVRDLDKIHLTRPEGFDEQRKAESYIRDPFQFERMIGDYYYNMQEYERAFTYYSSFYQDMNKPVQVFTPESMRNYVNILLRKGKTDEALLFMGFIINLRPYMLDDIFNFSGVYHAMGDRTSALLVLMFAHTLTEGYDEQTHERSRKLIDELCEEMQFLPEALKILELTDIYLSGNNLSQLQLLIDGVKKEGAQHFFLYYLEGIYHFAQYHYSEALGRFTDFCEIYPYLADAYYYAMVCGFNLDLEKYSDEVITFSEMAIGLKPNSTIANMAKLYLGKVLGIEGKDCEKLLTPSEMGFILDNFLAHNAPVSSLDPLLASLTLPRNPYQVALIKLMSKIDRRKEEFVHYLKHVYDLFNENGRNNIKAILTALVEPLD